MGLSFTLSYPRRCRKGHVCIGWFHAHLEYDKIIGVSVGEFYVHSG